MLFRTEGIRADTERRLSVEIVRNDPVSRVTLGTGLKCTVLDPCHSSESRSSTYLRTSPLAAVVSYSSKIQQPICAAAILSRQHERRRLHRLNASRRACSLHPDGHPRAVCPLLAQ